MLVELGVIMMVMLIVYSDDGVESEIPDLLKLFWTQLAQQGRPCRRGRRGSAPCKVMIMTLVMIMVVILLIIAPIK